MKELEKRKFVYCMTPQSYEIELEVGCPKCHGENFTWSEYVGHLWCYDCEIDFPITFTGIFSGPIPMGVATNIFGMSFDRINIETHERIPSDSPEWDKAWP
jgi:hypothetical protein